MRLRLCPLGSSVFWCRWGRSVSGVGLGLCPYCLCIYLGAGQSSLPNLCRRSQCRFHLRLPSLLRFAQYRFLLRRRARSRFRLCVRLCNYVLCFRICLCLYGWLLRFRSHLCKRSSLLCLCLCGFCFLLPSLHFWLQIPRSCFRYRLLLRNFQLFRHGLRLCPQCSGYGPCGALCCDLWLDGFLDLFSSQIALSLCWVHIFRLVLFVGGPWLRCCDLGVDSWVCLRSVACMQWTFLLRRSVLEPNSCGEDRWSFGNLWANAVFCRGFFVLLGWIFWCRPGSLWVSSVCWAWLRFWLLVWFWSCGCTLVCPCQLAGSAVDDLWRCRKIEIYFCYGLTL